MLFCLNIRAVKSNVTQQAECQGARSASISLPGPYQVMVLKENLSNSDRPLAALAVCWLWDSQG